MTGRLVEHLLSLCVVTAVLVVAVVALDARREAQERETARQFQRYGDLSFVDTGDPFHRALLKDVVDVYFPGQVSRNDSLVQRILDHQRRELSDRLYHSHTTERLSMAKIGDLGTMYAKFLAVYAVVMLLTYYGVQTIGVWRFCRSRRSPARASTAAAQFRRLVRKTILLAASLVLFSPAYVIAYSIRTEINTDTVFFMALLGVISNGLLMVYANKFYAFLVAESRRGYVETAHVKNLHRSYDRTSKGGIPLRAMLRPRKRFDGHVFGHIFENARFQYIPTLKEQASFLISGLIIIEMALNIHGHLSYEMLRQMLYRNYDIVIAIVLAIFWTVKGTEVFADIVAYRESRKYENTGVES